MLDISISKVLSVRGLHLRLLERLDGDEARVASVVVSTLLRTARGSGGGNVVAFVEEVEGRVLVDVGWHLALGVVDGSGHVRAG